MKIRKQIGCTEYYYDRNLRILRLWCKGWSAGQIMRIWFLSRERIAQIVRRSSRVLMPESRGLTPVEIRKEYRYRLIDKVNAILEEEAR